MQVAYLTNPSEETIFGSNRIKKQHKTMKLQNEEVICSAKHLKPSLMNSTDQQSETFI